jgi:hypothetical protein
MKTEGLFVKITNRMGIGQQQLFDLSWVTQIRRWGGERGCRPPTVTAQWQLTGDEQILTGVDIFDATVHDSTNRLHVKVEERAANSPRVCSLREK